MIYSAAHGQLIIRNTGSVIATIDVGTGQSANRVATASFADMAISPSGRFVFGADYGGENIGYGTPAAPSRVHRLDLVNNTWESKTAYIAGGVQAVSDEQFILRSNDQFLTFTNNTWGTAAAVVPLNTSSGSFYGPGYYPSVYSGDFRYDVNSARLLHGNSGSSSHEIQAFGFIGNDFVKREGSGIYGSANGYGGSVALATDGSAFYYGRLQVDPLDVTFNRRVFPETINAATGNVAFGNGNIFDAHTGNLIASLGFDATVYALNPAGADFWAFDAGQSLLRHFTFASITCGTPVAPIGVSASRTQGTNNIVVTWTGIAGATGYNIYMAKRSGVNKGNYAALGGQSRLNVTSPHTEFGLDTGDYYLVVTAYNNTGESVESAQVLVNVPDTQAPTVPSGVSAMAQSSSRINVSWSASTDNIGVYQYTIYRGNNYAGSAYAPQVTFADYGLAGSTSYSYTVLACDSAYNCSAKSAAASATTLVSSTPNSFYFSYRSAVARNSPILSDSITVSGIDIPVTISITGGEYSIDGAAFTSGSGTVFNGQSVVVRLTSSSTYSTQTSATLTIGGVSQTFSVNTMQQTFNAAQYFPLVAGNSWGMRKNGLHGTVTIGAMQLINGTQAVSMQDAFDGSVAYFTNDLLGLRQHRIYFPPGFIAGCGIAAETDTYSLPLVILPASFALSSSYSSGNVIADSGACGNLSFGYNFNANFDTFERVVVPAGQFDAIKVRHTLSLNAPNFSSSTTQTVWYAAGIGRVKQLDSLGNLQELVSTTLMRTAPDEMTFASQANVALNVPVVSNSVVIGGTTAAAAVSIVGGEYSIDGGTFTSAVGSVANGQSVSVRLSSSAQPGITTTATLNVGGVSALFSVTTGSAPLSAPTSVSAVAGYATILVRFSQPSNNGGAASIGYSTTCTSSNGGVGVSGTASATATSLRIVGVTIGKLYTCTVTAINANGPGPASVPTNAIKPFDLLPILMFFMDGAA